MDVWEKRDNLSKKNTNENDKMYRINIDTSTFFL